MTWTIKQRPHLVAPMIAEYECPVHGRFEALVDRDAAGDPPAGAKCQAFDAIDHHCQEPPCMDCGVTGYTCLEWSPWRISAPALKRDSVPCYAAVKGGDTERRPGMLDTRSLAEGASMKEWKAAQKAAQQERRHHQLIAKGLKTKRVQV